MTATTSREPPGYSRTGRAERIVMISADGLAPAIPASAG